MTSATPPEPPPPLRNAQGEPLEFSEPTPTGFIIGAGVVGAGLYQFYKAYSNKFEKRLRMAQVSADSRQWVRRVAKLGLTARGVTFVVIGWFLVRAGLTTDAGEARGLGGALRTLSQQDYGPWLLGGVGIGLAAYGAFAIVTGRYRQIG